MHQPLTAARVPVHSSLDDCLNIGIRWTKTNDPTALWCARLGAETWTVRVNDFPEEHLYTLFVNDEELGSFDEWPRQWSRVKDESNVSRTEPRPAP